MLTIPEPHAFESAGWIVHHWRYKDDVPITVLHREPFRYSWFATQLVTYVFLIPRAVETYSEVAEDYPMLRSFAGEHKRTLLPFMIQCEYALLPIYINTSFPRRLIDDVQRTYKKRRCVMHVPSLLDGATAQLHTLETKYFWGCVYRQYIRSTLSETASMVLENRDPARSSAATSS